MLHYTMKAYTCSDITVLLNSKYTLCYPTFFPFHISTTMFGIISLNSVAYIIHYKLYASYGTVLEFLITCIYLNNQHHIFE